MAVPDGAIPKAMAQRFLCGATKNDKLVLYKERLDKTKIREGYLNLESGRAVKKNDGNLKKFEFDEQLKAAIPKSADALKTFSLL